MIEPVLKFIGSFNTTQILIATMVSMILAFILGWQLTGSPLIGVLFAESINCLNLTIYATAWLGLGIKPFMPLWMSLLIFVAPFVFLFFSRLYFEQPLNKE